MKSLKKYRREKFHLAVGLCIALLATVATVYGWHSLTMWAIAGLPAWGRVLAVVGWIFVGGPMVLVVAVGGAMIVLAHEAA